MRVKHDAANGNWTTIATKISLADKVRLRRIAEGFGMTLYEMMQALLVAMTRYFDKGNIVTDEGNSLLNALGNVIFASKDSFNPIALKGRQQQRVCNAILFLQRNESQRPQLMEAQIDRQGNIVESYNYDDMLSTFLNCLDPDALQRLKIEAERKKYFSITQALHEIVMQRTDITIEDTISAEVRELFDDVRIPTGQMTNEEIYYKRKQNRGDYTTITKRKNISADLDQRRHLL
jgi:hypothetical protein